MGSLIYVLGEILLWRHPFKKIFVFTSSAKLNPREMFKFRGWAQNLIPAKFYPIKVLFLFVEDGICGKTCRTAKKPMQRSIFYWDCSPTECRSDTKTPPHRFFQSWSGTERVMGLLPKWNFNQHEFIFCTAPPRFHDIWFHGTTEYILKS